MLDGLFVSVVVLFVCSVDDAFTTRTLLEDSIVDCFVGQMGEKYLPTSVPSAQKKNETLPP